MILEEKLISGVYCPCCKSDQSKLKDSRLIDGFRLRSKECTECGNRWMTKEILFKYDLDKEKNRCIYCGNVFKPLSKMQKTCGSEECKRKLNNYNARKWNELKKEKKKDVLSVSQISKMAKEKGMSYGEYVQMYNV